MRQYNINYQIYADDTQLYCAFELESFDQVFSSIRTCICDIRSWMIKNKLKINDDKTELLIITSPRSKFATDLQLSIGQCEITPHRNAKVLGLCWMIILIWTLKSKHLPLSSFSSKEHPCNPPPYYLILQRLSLCIHL